MNNFSDVREIGVLASTLLPYKKGSIFLFSFPVKFADGNNGSCYGGKFQQLKNINMCEHLRQYHKVNKWHSILAWSSLNDLRLIKKGGKTEELKVF